mmetsp:Transcript_37646/g.88044  ORF Transcript_37646/g.88044 Transcript_37646/m.88044 type:complete len:314 (+) Transcript_37646:154-1095(+)
MRAPPILAHGSGALERGIQRPPSRYRRALDMRSSRHLSARCESRVGECLLVHVQAVSDIHAAEAKPKVGSALCIVDFVARTAGKNEHTLGADEAAGIRHHVGRTEAIALEARVANGPSHWWVVVCELRLAAKEGVDRGEAIGDDPPRTREQRVALAQRHQRKRLRGRGAADGGVVLETRAFLDEAIGQGAHEPADAKARERKDLRHAGERDALLVHIAHGRQRRVTGCVLEPAVHLIRQHECAARTRDGDYPHLLGGSEVCSGWIVRKIDHECPDRLRLARCYATQRGQVVDVKVQPCRPAAPRRPLAHTCSP